MACCRDKANANITESKSLKFKIDITGKTPANGNTTDVTITGPLTFSNFRRTLEMPLSNCESNLISAWSKNCVISSAAGETKFKITVTKLYVPLSTQEKIK